MSVILSVDLGFVQTKAITEDWLAKFSSLVKRASSTEINVLDDSEGYRVGVGGVTYRVGAKGTYDFTGERMARETDMPKLCTVLGLLCQEKGVRIINRVITGLPIDEYNSYKDRMKQSLKGQVFYFTFDNHPITVSIQDADIIPQSAGAFYDLILDDTGDIRKGVFSGDMSYEELAGQNVLTVDIGGRTTDVCIMEASRYSQDSFTIFQGVWRLHDYLRKLVFKRYHYQLKPWEVDNVAKTGALVLGSVVHPCSDLVQAAVEQTFPDIWDSLTLQIEDFRRYSHVLLTGGGAHLYYPAFSRAKMGLPISVMPDAEYSNAKGYYKYGLLTEA